MAAPQVPWVANGEAANDAVTKRPLKYILTASGMDVDATGFTGFAPVYSPKAFLAAEDGVTDDAGPLGNCIADAGAAGGVVRGTPGKTYRVRSKLSITAPLLLLGHGVTFKFDFPVGTSNVNGALIAVLSSNVTIDSLTVDGTGVTGTITGVNRYAFRTDPTGATRYSNIKYRNCRFTNLTQYSGTLPATTTVTHAVYARQVDRITVEGCEFDTISGSCQYFSDCTYAQVVGNTHARFGWSGTWMHDSNSNWTITRNVYTGGTIANPSYWGGAIDVMGQTSDQNLPGLPDEKGIISFNQFIGGVYRYSQVVRVSSGRRIVIHGNLWDKCDAENSATPGALPGTAAAPGAHNNLLELTVRDITVNNGPHKWITVTDNQFIALGAGYQKAIYVITQSGAGGPSPNTTPGEGLDIRGNQFICPDTSSYFLTCVAVHGFGSGYKDITICDNMMKGVPGSNTNYAPGGVYGLIVLMTNSGTSISGVLINGNHFEFFNGVGSTNNHVAINIQPDVTKVGMRGNRFKNFARAIILDPANTGDILLPLDNLFEGATNPISWRGVNLRPVYSGPLSLRMTFDVSATSNTTLANVAEMGFPIAANEEWHASITLDAGTDLKTHGLKLAVTTPAGATQNIIASLVPDVFTAANTSTKRTTVSGTALDFTAALQAGVSNGQVKLTVWVLNGATPGTVQLQLAQSTSSATPATLRKGSALVAERIA